MADVISRLKLESGEFDSKIKRAAQGIQRMAEECHNAGGILNQLEDENRAYIQSLGSMATVATTAKGKLAELTAAFTDIRSQYNALSDEEKNGEVGQELNKQLEIMKGRIIAAKTELGDINRELGNTGKQSEETGGLLDSLSQKFGINTKQLLSWGSALLAAKGYIGLVSDAIHQNEEATDVWEQTVRAGSTTYDAFVNALNTGDFAGFFSSINDIVDAATRAAKALDDLKTKGGIISNYEARLNAERAELLKIIKDPKSTQEEVADAQRRLKVNQSHRGKAAQETADLNNNYIREALWERARSQGMTKAEFKKYYRDIVRSLYDTSAFDRLGKINIKRNKAFALDEMGHALPGTDSYTINLGSVFTDEFRDSLNPYIHAYWNAQSNRYNQERADNRLAGGGRSGGGGDRRRDRHHGRRGGRGGGKAYEPKTQVIDMKPMEGLGMPDIYDRWGNKIETPKPQVLTPEQRMRNEILTQGQGLLSGTSPLTFPEQSAETQAFIKRKANQVDREAGYEELGKKFDESSKTWADMNSHLNNIVAGVESLGIEVPSGFKKMIGLTQTISSVMSAITSVLWIMNTSNWVDTVIPFHTGGVVRAATGTTVPGNYGFDAVPALLTSGETVLTRAQAGNLASQLQQGSKGESTMQPYTTGENIYLGMKNHLQRNGQGEIVTTSMLRRMGLIA